MRRYMESHSEGPDRGSYSILPRRWREFDYIVTGSSNAAAIFGPPYRETYRPTLNPYAGAQSTKYVVVLFTIR